MDKFIKGFFWFAFAAFLAASIPHVAYFFRSFEPQGASDDLYWWGLSYCIAGSIDVTIFLLSLTVARLHRRGNATGLIASVWVFIIGLTALSWFINWEYAQEFSSSMLAHVANLQVTLLGFTVKIGDINPVIASMFQVLAIAYTWISDKVAADEKPKSAQELKAIADEEENRRKELARLKGFQQADTNAALDRVFGHAGGLIKRGKTLVTEIRNDESKTPLLEAPKTDHQEPDITVINDETEEVKPGEQEPQNESIEPGKTDLKPEESNGHKPDFARLLTDSETVFNRYPELLQLCSPGRVTLTIDDIVLATKISRRKIVNRVNDRTLKHAPRNPGFVTLTSLIPWLKTVIDEEEKAGKTGDKPSLKIVGKDDEKAS